MLFIISVYLWWILESNVDVHLAIVSSQLYELPLEIQLDIY